MFRYFFQRDGVVCLFDGIDGVSMRLQVPYCVQGLLVIRPCHALFGTKGSLVYLCVRRTAADAAQHHALDTHRIRRTEDGTDIMLAAYIIEHHYQRQLVRPAVLVNAHTPQLIHCIFDMRHSYS